jgi:hypothetical protein
MSLDDYMQRLRQAERVIMREEARHGKYSRDPDNRIVPRVQALARRAAIELRLDDYRPIDQPAHTTAYAPHAARSDIGAFDKPLIPHSDYHDPIRSSKFLSEHDVDVEPFRRGETKLGGILSLMEARGVDQTRERKPLIPRIASSIEFSRYRKEQHSKKRLNMISSLKDDLQRMIDQRHLPTPPASPSQLQLQNLNQNQEQSNSQIPSSSDVLILSSEPSSSRGGSRRSKRSHEAAPPDSIRTSSNRSRLTKSRVLKRSVVTPYHPSNSSILSEQSSIIDEDSQAVLIALENYQQQLQTLNQEESHLCDINHHLEQKLAIALKYKAQERKWCQNEKSRQIERKRRLLTPAQGRRKIPLNDEPNIFDYYATRIQATIRGWLGRAYSKWYAIASHQSSRVVQRYYRGWICRYQIKREKRRNDSATMIQKCFRGWKARSKVSVVTDSRDHINSVILIQRIVRGWLGKRRLTRKQELDETSRDAFLHIDEYNLSADDIKELGERIENALANNEGESVDLPPEEVLICLKIIVLIIGAVRGAVGYTSYDFINQRYFYDIDGQAMGWMESGKLCVRSNRLLHILRSLTYGPTSKPPRLLYIPKTAMKLYYQLKYMSNWNLTSLQSIGAGSRCCCQLYSWLTSIVDVHYKQPEFLSYLTSTFPDWLRDLFQYRETRRKCEFDLALRLHCDELLATEEKLAKDRLSALKKGKDLDQAELREKKIYLALIDRERKILKKSIETIQAEHAQNNVSEERLIHDQAVRERYSIMQYESKFIDAKRNYEKILHQYKHDHQVAELANVLHAPSIQRNLTEQRRLLDNQRMVLEELETQMKLLLIQIGKNEERRRNLNIFPSTIQEALNQAAEIRGQHMMAQLQCKLYLKLQGVKNARFLSDQKLLTYEILQAKEDELKLQYNNLSSKADQMRMEYDLMMKDRAEELMVSDNLSKDQLMPSEEQLQQERLEDDEQAHRERNRSLQFISSEVMTQAANITAKPPDSNRVHLILLSRDIPSYLRARITQELAKLLETNFAMVDNPKACCGLDFQAIQAAIKSSQYTIVYVDVGLTQLTMTTFVETLKLLQHALVPKPTINILKGDDSNPGRSQLTPHSGISWQDLKMLRDGDIKRGLDSMGCLRQSLRSKTSIRYFRMLGEEILPPEHSFILVIEALLRLLGAYASEDELSLPYILRPGMQWNGESWSSAQVYLREPLFILSKLDLVRRGVHDIGTTIALIETMVKYCSHRFWPKPGAAERISFSLINDICGYIEAWCLVERKTIERGGTPKIILNKAIHPSIECVATVSDSLNPNDESKIPNSWYEVVNKVLKCILADYLVTCATRVLDDVLYISSIYRIQDRIYFELYNPKSSDSFITKCTANQVPSILSPNAKQLQIASLHSSIDNGDVMSIELHPPRSGHELYTRLLSYLTLQSHDKQHRANAICKRVYSKLATISHSINGYQAEIRAYEVALGEMYFSAVISDFKAELETYITLDDRLPLYRNADHELERPIFDSDDVSKILHQVMDRLVILPNRSMIKTAQVLAFSPQLSLSQHNLSIPKPALKVQMTQGVGRVIYKGVVTLSSSKYLLIVRSCAVSATGDGSGALNPKPARLLKVTLYEAKQRLIIETRISNYLSRVLFSFNSDDDGDDQVNAVIVGRLINRMSVVGEEIQLDRTIVSRHLQIHGEQYQISIEATDDDHAAKISIISKLAAHEKYACALTAKEMTKLSKLVEPSLDFEQDLLPQADLAVSFDADEQEFGDGSCELMEAWYKNEAVMDNAMSNLIMRMKPRATNLKEGFYIDKPVILILYPEAHAEVSSKSLVRQQPPVKLTPSALPDNFRYRNRKQLPVLLMKDALNKLANEKNLASRCHSDRIITMNAELAAHLEDLEKSAAIYTENTAKAVRDVLLHAVSQTCSQLVYQIVDSKAKHSHSLSKRPLFKRPSNMKDNKPMRKQVSFEGSQSESKDDDQRLLEQMAAPGEVESEIIGKRESLIYHGSNIRAIFREGNTRWHDFVNLSVYESTCWTNLDGKGRRLRFVVSHIDKQLWNKEGDEEEDEDGSEQEIEVRHEGYIRNSRQLQQILGTYGQDLLHEQKRQEMVLYIAKYCMQIMKSSTDYHIEFASDRLYDVEDIEYVSSIEIKDSEQDNKIRKQELSRLKGQKIHRLTRRINGLLLQLTVYDVDREILPQLILQQQQIQDKNEKLYQNEFLIAVKPSENQSPVGGLTPTLQQQLSFIRTPKGDKSPITETSLQTPAFRIIGYDPRRKRKAMCIALPAAIVEIAGGKFSPLLQSLDQRIELAKVVCEQLVAFFPRGAENEFELVLRWSRAPRITGMVIVRDKSSSVASAPSYSSGAAALGSQEAAIAAQQAAVDKILRRPYKLYHHNLVITNYECIVAIFAEVVTDLPSNRSAASVSSRQQLVKKSIIVNVYVKLASESMELIVSEDEQVERLGKCALDYPEGSIRDAAMRRFCRFLQVRLEEDDFDMSKQVIRLALLEKKRAYLSEYLTIEPRSTDLTAVRPMGVPTPFLPLDSLGYFIYRRSMNLALRKILYFSSKSDKQRFQEEEQHRECIVSVYSKSASDPPERGLVLKIYDQKSRGYSILHAGSSSLENLCKNAAKAELLEKMRLTRISLEQLVFDDFERDFQMTTEAGDASYEANKLVLQLVDIVLADLGLQETPDLKYIAYFRSSAYGVLPT